ncbi:MAG TPA: hypothetical protein VGR84_18880 [Candidatus Acidoferrales bacterium]|nr:hypothetical protein [Candidatus Acidoferrales bacterium]
MPPIRVVGMLIQDAEGNTLGTVAHPLCITEQKKEGSGSPARASELMVIHFVDDAGNILGSAANPLVVTIVQQRELP